MLMVLIYRVWLSSIRKCKSMLARKMLSSPNFLSSLFRPDPTLPFHKCWIREYLRQRAIVLILRGGHHDPEEVSVAPEAALA